MYACDCRYRRNWRARQGMAPCTTDFQSTRLYMAFRPPPSASYSATRSFGKEPAAGERPTAGQANHQPSDNHANTASMILLVAIVNQKPKVRVCHTRNVALKRKVGNCAARWGALAGTKSQPSAGEARDSISADCERLHDLERHAATNVRCGDGNAD